MMDIYSDKKIVKDIVDIYPAMNPLGIDSVTRSIPAFDLDMNRIFPGSSDGSMTDVKLNSIVEKLLTISI